MSNAQTEQDAVARWAYDEIDQLVTESRSAGLGGWYHLTVGEWDELSVDHWFELEVEETFDLRLTSTYDPAGNRLTEATETGITTSVYDDANRLIYSEAAAGRTTHTYDAAGNQIFVEIPAGDLTTYTYGPENRNTVVETVSATITFVYNGEEQRVARDDGSNEVRYVWDAKKILHETDDVGVTQAVSTYIPDEFGDLISQSRDLTSLYHHYDAQGSTRELTDDVEVVTDSYVYQAFGKLESSTGTSDNPYTWKGRIGYYKDPDLDRYTPRRNDYEPAPARWLSPDPLGVEADTNLYRYVGNNAVNDADPGGMQGSRSRQNKPKSPSVKGWTVPTTYSMEAVDRFVKQGLAWYYKGTDVSYAVVIDATGAQISAMILHRTHSVGRGSRPSRYKLVSYRGVGTPMPVGSDKSPVTLVRALQNQEHADRQIEQYLALQDDRARQLQVAAHEFVLHTIPLGAAVDYAIQGNYGEVGISLAGDAAFFLSGGTSLVVKGSGAAARVAGGAAVRTTARFGGQKAAQGLAKVLATNIEQSGRVRTAFLVLEGGVGVARGSQAIFALRDGETGEAAGYFGEAFLRLIGVRAGIINKYKDSAKRATKLRGEIGEIVAPSSYSASLGKATSTNYKGTFFKANPALEGEVVVHHAIEQQVLTKYPGVITEAELHSLENLRGIPKSINSEVHLSKIRIEWNKFYKPFDLNGTVPTRQQLLDKATEIDKLFGSQFTPPVGG